MEEKQLKELLMETKNNIELGRLGEELASRYLIAHDFEIMERNWRCDSGEADIIAKEDDGTVCFIEVKTRRGEQAGLPEEAITKQKRRKYEHIALSYMAKNKLNDMTPIRFDSIAICIMEGISRALLRHSKAAFSGCQQR